MWDSEVMTMVRVLLLAAGVIVGVFLVAPAMAVEPICPGGSSPRADITHCMDFDTLTNCITGQEDLCWVDNGYLGYPGSIRTQYNHKIVVGGGAVGNGFIRGRPQPGSTGSGFGNIEPIFIPGVSAFNMRYYIKYSRGYVSFETGHNVQMEASTPGFTCTSALKFQMSTYSGFTYYPSGCGTGSILLPPNQGQSTKLLNNRWYMIEVHGKIDDFCSNINDPHGCNGEVKVWIDD